MIIISLLKYRHSFSTCFSLARAIVAIVIACACLVVSTSISALTFPDLPKEYDGTVFVRGNEPFTYAVFVTTDQAFAISGPLVELLVADHQQCVIRILGFVDQRKNDAPLPEQRLPVLVVERIIEGCGL